MEKAPENIGEDMGEHNGTDSVPGQQGLVDFVDFRNRQEQNAEQLEDYEENGEEIEQAAEQRRRPEENFKTGGFIKEYYSEAFSFSKEHEGVPEGDHRRQQAGVEQGEDGSGGFQQMKSRSQAAMSSAQIIKYHNFVAKRAKKVFTTLLKGYSPV